MAGVLMQAIRRIGLAAGVILVAGLAARAAGGETLSDLRQRFQDREQKAIQVVREECLGEMEKYIAANPKGADREEALVLLLQLANDR
ncbi:MAG: hypothetical protein V1809_15545, partial [Planctomycetota bacterium]